MHQGTQSVFYHHYDDFFRSIYTQNWHFSVSHANDEVRQGQTIIPGGKTCFQGRNYVPTLMKFDVVVRTASVTFD